MASLAPHSAPAPPAADGAPTRERAVGQAALTLAGLGAVLVAGRAVGIHAPACPFRTMTGVPCPGCGMTRLADAVAHGKIPATVTTDPAGVALLAVIAVVSLTFLVRVVIQKRPAPAWFRSPVLLLGAALLLAAHWATTLVNGLPRF